MKPVAVTLFAGFGGADIALREAGFELAAGLEYDARIAEVANTNLGGHVRVMNILGANPRTFPACDLLHFSPPCTRASVANKTAAVNKDGIRESPLDIALAKKCCEFIRVLSPRLVTMENVSGYRVFKSFGFILYTLESMGYFVHYSNQCAADFGVPQTRRRLYLRASRGLLPPLPEPTPWLGWYGAIEDLIDGLPESRFAKWQMDRFRDDDFLRTFLTSNQKSHDRNMQEYPLRQRGVDSPAMTIRSQHQSAYRAFIVDGKSDGRVVAMTPRAVARFQSFPDWYILPENNALAYRGIGNAVAVRHYRTLITQLRETL